MIWVIGKGLVSIDKQFILDCPRIPMYLNNEVLPNQKVAIERLLDCKYAHTYFKYMNQTLGNMIIEHLPYSPSYALSLHAYTHPAVIQIKMSCIIYDQHVKYQGSVQCKGTFYVKEQVFVFTQSFNLKTNGLISSKLNTGSFINPETLRNT